MLPSCYSEILITRPLLGFYYVLCISTSPAVQFCYHEVTMMKLKKQGCKLLSDIGQCPTKFGKCPSKSNFDRTLVQSKKYIVTYIFCCDKIRLQIHSILHFAINFTRHSSILLNVAPEWLYTLVS